MNEMRNDSFDKTNAVIGAAVFIFSFIIYALTVQRSIPFWDCGEFIACSYILGIPHPPGTPLFVLIGRLFAMTPFVEDISYRVNYISVISSAFTALFSYLLTVKLISYFFNGKGKGGDYLGRYIAYIGGIAGALFVTFSQTNWANSVEAEVYSTGMAVSVMIVWITLKYFEQRGTLNAVKMMILTFYLALLGIGIHMAVFLVVPACALFFILKKDAEPRDWLILCGFIIVELALIFLFANGRGGPFLFFLISAMLGLVMVVLLYKKINWAILIGVASASSIMLAFSKYIIITPIALIVLVVLGILSERNGWGLKWKSALALVLVAFIGMSVHLYIPIRSAQNPRIDENNPSRDWQTFVNFLDRKQYGQISMIDRMFERRGTWENQFGRHPHMGFWSYFEEQYSKGGWNFFPFLALGVIGLVVAARRRIDIGVPFLTLFLICSVGLVLYMNFADGVKYNLQTGDAYLEVRNRDYFFAPAFVFFGIAMGMGVAAVMKFIRDGLAGSGRQRQKMAVYASTMLVLLPGVSLANNYHANDRSDNFIPYNYAADVLDSCEENALLFTSGDNDTFPLWCLQEAYNYRRDVVVICLSLLNTDWYIEQMKNRYGVPMSLTDEQILWYPTEVRPGLEINQPRVPFVDRPRGVRTLLSPYSHQGTRVRVQDMMVDDIVLENQFKRPVYFTSPPYESPLNLRDRATNVGMLFRLDLDPPPTRVDLEKGLDLYANVYNFDGFKDSKVFRDENTTGVFMAMGLGAVRVFEELIRSGQTDSALAFGETMTANYPEYWNMFILLAEQYERSGDTASADNLLQRLHDTLTAFVETNESNVYYLQDLGLTKAQLGRRNNDQAQIDEGVRLLMKAFELYPNNSYGFRKLVTVLSQENRLRDLNAVANEFARYKRNLQDPFLQRILNINPGAVPRRGP